MRFHHVQIAMPPGGEYRARVFYRDALGLEEIPRPEELGGAGVWFRAGEAEIHLAVEEDFHPAKKAHPGIEVDNVEALAERLIAHGFEARWDYRLPGRRFSTNDPFGNRLGFVAAGE
jgi:catechol 2,3-dioxygenase-like lactoylglutathione lyase family enzyme